MREYSFVVFDSAYQHIFNVQLFYLIPSSIWSYLCLTFNPVKENTFILTHRDWSSGNKSSRPWIHWLFDLSGSFSNPPWLVDNQHSYSSFSWRKLLYLTGCCSHTLTVLSDMLFTCILSWVNDSTNWQCFSLFRWRVSEIRSQPKSTWVLSFFLSQEGF